MSSSRELVGELQLRFDTIMKDSPFLADLSRSAPAGKRDSTPEELRALTAEEIAALERLHNVCEDWSLIRVAEDFVPDRIVGNLFRGRCGLGRFTSDDDTRLLPTGIYFSTIADSYISTEARIHRCPLVSGYVVESGAFLLASTVTMPGSSSFGNGTKLSPGLESGGRELTAFADLDYDLAVELTRNVGEPQVRRITAAFLEGYVESCRLSHGYIGGYARITSCTRIDGCWIGAGAQLDGVTEIRNSTLLSSPDEPCLVTGGAVVRDSILQWGTEVSSGAVVQRSILLEHAGAEKHANIEESVVCANSRIGEGEVTSSFVGPFVGFHHQALLIAVYWPDGRGNVGYGANIGSNHTSRVPDQELWAGEGMFFGLGSSVKFPANFMKAPHTIIATGVTTLPQRMELPFSLIMGPTETRADRPPAENRLIPAWVLSNNLYAVMRNHQKFAARNRARRARFDLSLFRPETVALMEEAAARLESVSGKELYTDSDIPGVGKNHVTDEDRRHGAEWYRRFVSYARHSRLRERLNEQRRSDGHASNALKPEERASASSQLAELTEIIDTLRDILTESREKDLRRGRRIIDDYDQTHPALDDDEFLLATRGSLHAERENAEQLIEWLSAD